ncbi:hypothetical protein M1M34_gp084 [Haloarcula tailed virus 2]|uniref:Uncharacterized protein n=1 Tax=Haloarcula tailed virus 2 TaxID=2877989 RepID=A0AAE8XZZ4_9CAUD|nr:hypothetical protein M1M34_gp084 [Haloarcula tailed virus 2]UBF23249.1 hypothetical protein HATV-2_gp98 [Haloarcula tailed virus 2]
MQNKIDSGLVAELIMGELPEWYVGVCTVRYDEVTEDMLVYGENDLMAGSVSTDVWTNSVITVSRVKNTAVIADRVNGLIEAEHAEL